MTAQPDSAGLSEGAGLPGVGALRDGAGTPDDVVAPGRSDVPAAAGMLDAADVRNGAGLSADTGLPGRSGLPDAAVSTGDPNMPGRPGPPDGAGVPNDRDGAGFPSRHSLPDGTDVPDHSTLRDRTDVAGRLVALRIAFGRIPRPARIVVQEILVVASTLTCVLLSHPSTFAFAVPAAVVACLALPLRLRWPWLSMIACLVALSAGLGLAPAIAALYRVGRREKALVILAWTAAAVLASALPVLVTQNLSWSDATLTVAFSILWMTAPSAGGVLITTRQQLTESLAELRRARRAELEAREEQARAQERTRIGQEIHDAVGHHATLIAVEAAALASTTDAVETRRVALRVRALAKESLSEMRAALGLADEPQEAGTSIADLPGLLGRARQAGVQIDFDDADSLPTSRLAPVVGRAVYRIVQATPHLVTDS
jgi:signal transduction histidine kinase